MTIVSSLRRLLTKNKSLHCKFSILLFVVVAMAGPPVTHSLTTTTTTTTTTSLSQAQARVAARKIRHTCETVEQAWETLDLDTARIQKEQKEEVPLHELVAAELLNLCAKEQNAEMALRICQRAATSDIVRSRTVSILGQCGRHVDALNVLTMLPPLSTTSSFTSAIAALGKSKEWQAVLCILNDMPAQLVTTVTLNAALQALRKAKRSAETLSLLQKAVPVDPWPKATPDRTSYHTTLSCLVEQGQVNDACALVRQMEQQHDNPNLQPNGDTYSRLASNLTPEHWKIVQTLLPDKMDRPLLAPMDFQKWTLPKRGRGKNAYWELGRFVASDEELLVVALQPNRNPAVNGMKLTFYRRQQGTAGGSRSDAAVKLGYLLMINSQQEKTSQFLGQFVDQSSRGQGLAKIWLAIWLRLCLDAGLRPCTGKIRKPLLCLVLQHSFGMLPQSGGVEVTLSPGEEEGQVVLYSPLGQALEGAVSPLDLKHQNIFLSKEPPNPPGRNIVLGCDFEPPDTNVLEALVSPVLQNRFSLIEAAKQGDLSRFLLGV